MENKRVKLQIKSVDSTGEFVGLAAVYGNRDYGGDVILPGAFTKSIQEKGGKFPLFYQHQVNVGVSAVEDTPEGLLTKGFLNMQKQVAKDLHSDMLFYKEHGLDFGMSIGYKSIPDKTEIKNGSRVLREVMLFENTLDELPLNDKARVIDVKSLVLSHKSDFATELDAIQTWAMRYQMISALESALSSCCWGEGTPEQKTKDAETSIEQFRTGFMEYMPKLMALMDSKYKSVVDGLEKKGRDQMGLSAKSVESLLKGADSRSAEPGEAHSLLSFLKSN